MTGLWAPEIWSAQISLHPVISTSPDKIVLSPKPAGNH